jgi:nicotinamide mononucleotide transporter
MDLLHLLEVAWNYPVIPDTLKGGEALATLTGAIGVFLAARNRVSNFGWNIVSSLLYGGVFWQTGLYSSALLQVIGFFPLLMLGYWLWSRGKDTKEALAITRLRPVGWTVSIGFIVVFTIGWGLAMRHFVGVEQPFTDAAVTGASIVGQYLQSRRILENWHLWLAVNAVYAFYLLPSQGLWFTTGLYAVFLALAGYGLWQWRKEMPPAPEPPSRTA